MQASNPTLEVSSMNVPSALPKLRGRYVKNISRLPSG